MKIEWDDRMWTVDVNELSLTQAVVITGRTGVSLTAWEKALADPDSPQWLPSVQCFYWLMLQQDGQKVPVGDLDFPVLKYAQAVAAAVEQENTAAAEAVAEQDPTRLPVPDGETPAAAEPETAAAAG